MLELHVHVSGKGRNARQGGRSAIGIWHQLLQRVQNVEIVIRCFGLHALLGETPKCKSADQPQIRESLAICTPTNVSPISKGTNCSPKPLDAPSSLSKPNT